MSACRRLVAVSFLLGLCLLLAGPGRVAAQEPPSYRVGDTPLEITRGHAHIDFVSRTATLEGEPGRDVNILFGDRSITAGRILFHVEAGSVSLIEASDSVIIYDAGNLAFADSVLFEASTQYFMLKNARYSTNAYFISGERIEITADKTVVIHQGSLTTCDLWEPHYMVVSDRIVVKPGVRFWTYGTTYRVNNYPLAWLPFFTRSLRRRDHAFFLYPGYSSKKGVMAHGRFLYHYNSYLRPNVYVDYFENLGVGYGLSNRYRAPGDDGYDRLWGRVYGYRIDQDESDKYLVDGDRYRVAGYHWQRLPYDFLLTSRYQRLSDRDFNNDFEREETAKGWSRDELEMERNSFVNLARTADLYNFRIIARKRLDDFFLSPLPDTEHAPQARLELKRDLLLELGELPVYYYATADLGRYRREAGSGMLGEETLFIDEVDRADLNLELSSPFSLFEAVRAIPFVNFRATEYQDPQIRRRSNVTPPAPPALVEDNLVAYDYDDTTRLLGRAGVAFQSRLAHHFDSFLENRYEKTRLVVQPRVSFEAWKMNEELLDVDFDGPDPSYDVRRLTREPVAFPFIDSTELYREDEGRIGYRLDSKLQGKRAASTHDIARAAISGGYFTDSRRTEEHEDLVAELFVHPAEWISFSSYTQYDINVSETRANNAGITFLRLPGLPSTMLTLAWAELQPFEGDRQSHLTLGLFHPLSDKWSMILDSRYDIEEGDSHKNSLRLTRDLHDWWWDILLKHEERAFRESEFEISTRIRLKFPDDQDRTMEELAKRKAVPY